MCDTALARAEVLASVLYSDHDHDESVKLARTLEREHGEDPWSHYVLGMALGVRYVAEGDRADLDGGLEHLREAIRLGGSEDPDAATFRQQLAGALGVRWSRALMEDPDTDPAELAEALDVAREGLAMTDAHSPHLPDRLTQVAELLAQGAAGPEGLTEAVELIEGALSEAHPDDPRLSRFQHSHARILSLAAARPGADPALAEAAETSALKAGDLAPAYDPAQAGIAATIRSARMFRIRSAG
ncbi:hypothetical protein GTW20_24320 [Nocardiopsis alba]|uniref:Tetratricopeptide repeat protein n=1 Tax=Nocardiopsis alba TaxID=53437 RepID=A0A7K2IZ92_9ACTN|nr:hypothetical protein [Nocardiopsis alba]MYR35301.1 hypothetical protein [Nocardiopsis alba]